jgi:adenine-specific DNA-methyltransferase
MNREQISGQLELDSTFYAFEDQQYLTDQLITYLGNKRSLIKHINDAIEQVRKELGGKRLISCDAFSGSGIVSRLLKRHSEVIWTNDLEDYATMISKAYLTNHDKVDWTNLAKTIDRLNELAQSSSRPKGFISELYAPKDDYAIQGDERVFYTSENAKRLDAYAQLIANEPSEIRPLLYGPLLSAASVNANTSGVFKGFYKDSLTGKGKFGGTAGDALKRILAPIELELPVLSRFNSEAMVVQGDANELPSKVGKIDLVYLDPPYNQHPYGSNYFMLNLLVNYRKPSQISRVSGIPSDWNRSTYNVRQEAFANLTSLVSNIEAKYVLISFSDDGFIKPQDLSKFLKTLGEVNVIDIDYNTYRGSRNLASRSTKIKEHIFILRKGQ